MYKAILFDFDDTLVDFSLCIQQALRNSIVHLKNVDWPRFLETFNSISSIYWGQSELYRKEMILFHSFRDTLKELKLLGDAQELADIYWHEFCHSAVLESKALDLLASLNGKIRLGIITNGFSDSQWGRLEAASIKEFFDVIIISEEAGVEKPNPEIFELALKKMDLQREEVLFVGDSLAHDGIGAKNAGIDFCWYNRKRKKPSEAGIAKYTVYSLEEAAKLIEGKTDKRREWKV